MGDEMFTKWKRMTVEELKAFLIFHNLMAMNHLPYLDDYWRQDPFLHYTPIADWITRDRYCELSRYLHFADNDTPINCPEAVLLYKKCMGGINRRDQPGHQPSQITTIPLRHFPIRILDESHSKDFKRGRCAHYKVHHCRKDTT